MPELNAEFLYAGLPVNLFRGIGMTKVSVYVDDEVWRAFKEKVFQKHGNLRSISKEVDDLLRSQNVEDQVISGFANMGIKLTGRVSSREIEENRPKSRGPTSLEILKEMRSKRLCSSSTSTQAHS